MSGELTVFGIFFPLYSLSQVVSSTPNQTAVLYFWLLHFFQSFQSTYLLFIEMATLFALRFYPFIECFTKLYNYNKKGNWINLGMNMKWLLAIKQLHQWAQRYTGLLRSLALLQGFTRAQLNSTEGWTVPANLVTLWSEDYLRVSTIGAIHML